MIRKAIVKYLDHFIYLGFDMAIVGDWGVAGNTARAVEWVSDNFSVLQTILLFLSRVEHRLLGWI